MNEFKHRLYNAMAYNGMTTADLVQATGIGTSSISKYLRGVQIPKTENIVKIAKALNVTVEWLIGK